MIDIKRLRDDFDAVAGALGRRGVERAELEKARDLDEKRRALLGETGKDAVWNVNTEEEYHEEGK